MTTINQLYSRLINAMGVEDLEIPMTAVKFYKKEMERRSKPTGKWTTEQPPCQTPDWAGYIASKQSLPRIQSGGRKHNVKTQLTRNRATVERSAGVSCYVINIFYLNSKSDSCVDGLYM